MTDNIYEIEILSDDSSVLLRTELQTELAMHNDGIELDERRVKSGNRFDDGMVVAILSDTVQVLSLVITIVKMLQRKKSDRTIKIRTDDGLEVEFPASLPLEEVQEKLQLQNKINKITIINASQTD